MDNGLAMITVNIIMKGEAADICVPGDSSRMNELEKFISTLSSKDKNDLFSLFKRFVETGFIPNIEKFRHEGGGIYAFKTRRIRVLSMFLPQADKRTQLLIHGYVKQRQKMPQHEYRKARKFQRQIEDEGYEFE